jgi:Integrase
MSAKTHSTPEQKNAQGNPKNAQETHRAKTSSCLPKTDVRYWLKKIRRTTWEEDGRSAEARTYSVQIQYRGRRVRFPLNLSGANAAAAKARDIYASLTAPTGGWEATLALFKPETLRPATVPTVGEYIAAARAVSTARPLTFGTYATKFRGLVAHLTGKEGDRRKNDYRGAIDPVTGKRSRPGAEVWRDEIDRVSLARITPESVTRWAVGYIAERGKNPRARRAAINTANALVRNSAALFAERITRHLKHLTLPAPLPFEGVELPKIERARYQSRFSVEMLYTQAKRDLWETQPAGSKEREAFVALVLGLFSGLRRGEIDRLTWAQVDFEAGGLSLEATQHGDVKSSHSAGFVKLADSVVALLKEKKESTRSPFVLESSALVRAPGEGRYHRYRCDCTFKRLTSWLRANGLKGEQKPLHAMRKEFGSFVNERFGLSAAADALRHSNVNLTRDYYARPDKRATFGPEHLTPTAQSKDSRPDGAAAKQA